MEALYADHLEDFMLMDVSRFLKRPNWGPGEGVDLTLGQPDFPASLRLRHALSDAVLAGPGGYVNAAGMPALREKIVAHHSRSIAPVNVENVVVTSGSSAGLFMTMRAVLAPGDEVLIFDPYFPGYKACAQLVGAKINFVATAPSYIPDLAKVESAITPRTRLMIVNSPNNPSGAVYSRETIIGLAEIARRHSLFVISDEVYDNYVYDGEHVSMAKYYDQVITLQGFSKSHGLTGWRLGYAVGPSEVMRRVALISQYLFACVPPFLQTAATMALDHDMSDVRERYRQKRDIILAGLKDRYEITRPAGAFYLLLRTPIAEQEFVDLCYNRKLAVFPGRLFSESEGTVRISFANSDDNIRRAVSILCNLS